ncbi:MAG: response regulator transcription factor [Vicinamibacteria bacterium]
MAITVLIADDDDAFRELAKRLLGRAVTLVGEASDGEAAVELARQHRPDVVLIDIDLPGLDGIAATQRIKGIDPSTRVILLTGHAEEAYLNSTGKTGADALLPKRSARLEILSAIRAVLGGLRSGWDGRERRGSGARSQRWDGRERRRQKAAPGATGRGPAAPPNEDEP